VAGRRWCKNHGDGLSRTRYASDTTRPGLIMESPTVIVCDSLKPFNSHSLLSFSATPPPLFPAKCQEPSGSSPALYQHLLFALKSHARTTAPLSTHLRAHALQVSAVQHALLPHAVGISSKLTNAHYFPARTQHRSGMFLLPHARVPQGGQGQGATYARARRCARARLTRLVAIPATSTQNRVVSTMH
jgi:hypothetical protein